MVTGGLHFIAGTLAAADARATPLGEYDVGGYSVNGTDSRTQPISRDSWSGTDRPIRMEVLIPGEHDGMMCCNPPEFAAL
jgi:hypothetical protein